MIPDERIFPPVIVRPEAEESPPLVPTFIPPANVEVAVEEEFSPPFSIVRPETFMLEVNVEDAVEIMPVVVASPEGPITKRAVFAGEIIWR
jgi:hypothetical protein